LKQVTATVVYNKRILGPGPYHGGQSLGGQLIRLHCPGIASEARPGQFVMVNCGEECFLPRPFSIHWVGGDDIALFFAVPKDGKGSQWLSLRRDSEGVEVFGPLGNGFSIRSGARRLLLVAGGMGLPPLCFLSHQAVGEKRSLTLLLGAAQGPLYTDIPENLLPPGIEIIGATDDGSVGHKGPITDLLPEHIDRADQVFVCGPLPMYKAMARMPALEGKPVQVSLEVRMGCGVGTCYGCTVKTKSGSKQVCKDGPVFDLAEIIWDEMKGI
jgi:dihydroorotate dehydrogenase electron transfer subunit